jgi:hypothetical protein
MPAAIAGIPPTAATDTGAGAKATRALGFPAPRALPADRRTAAAGSGPAPVLAASIPEPPPPITTAARDDVTDTGRGRRDPPAPRASPAKPSGVDEVGTDAPRLPPRSLRDPAGVVRVAPEESPTAPRGSAADEPPAPAPSAWATPHPVVRAMPTPTVRAPAPNHEYGFRRTRPALARAETARFTDITASKCKGPPRVRSRGSQAKIDVIGTTLMRWRLSLELQLVEKSLEWRPCTAAE